MIKAEYVLAMGVFLFLAGLFLAWHYIEYFDFYYSDSTEVYRGKLIDQEEILPGESRIVQINVEEGAEEIILFVASRYTMNLSVTITDPNEVVVYENKTGGTNFIILPAKAGKYTITFSTMGAENQLESSQSEQQVLASYKLKFTPEKYIELYGGPEAQSIRYILEKIVVPFVPGIIVIIIGGYMWKRQTRK